MPPDTEVPACSRVKLVPSKETQAIVSVALQATSLPLKADNLANFNLGQHRLLFGTSHENAGHGTVSCVISPTRAALWASLSHCFLDESLDERINESRGSFY